MGMTDGIERGGCRVDAFDGMLDVIRDLVGADE